MLAVVQHDQQLALTEHEAERLQRVRARALAHAERGGNFGCHLRRVSDGGELHQPYAMCVVVANRRRGRQRQSRLSNAAKAHKCEQACGTQRLCEISDLFLSADEAAERTRQIACLPTSS